MTGSGERVTPVDVVWEFVGDPRRYPEWWPRFIEIRGERFEEGSEFVQVSRGPVGRAQTTFLIERRDELREIRMRCLKSGAYIDWKMTAARDGTFVAAEFGMQPTKLQFWLFDVTTARRYFRKWLEQTVDALSDVAKRKSTSSADSS